MNPVRFEIMRYQYECRPLSGSLVTLKELSRLTGVHPEMIGNFMKWGLVDPECTEPELRFSEEAVCRIRRIVRLRNDLGINLAGVGLVLDLLERIDSLEQEIMRLRSRLAERVHGSGKGSSG